MAKNNPFRNLIIGTIWLKERVCSVDGCYKFGTKQIEISPGFHMNFCKEHSEQDVIKLRQN